MLRSDTKGIKYKILENSYFFQLTFVSLGKKLWHVSICIRNSLLPLNFNVIKTYKLIASTFLSYTHWYYTTKISDGWLMNIKWTRKRVSRSISEIIILSTFPEMDVGGKSDELDSRKVKRELNLNFGLNSHKGSRGYSGFRYGERFCNMLGCMWHRVYLESQVASIL